MGQGRRDRLGELRMHAPRSRRVHRNRPTPGDGRRLRRIELTIPLLSRHAAAEMPECALVAAARAKWWCTAQMEKLAIMSLQLGNGVNAHAFVFEGILCS